jgi:hypothetical protein
MDGDAINNLVGLTSRPQLVGEFLLRRNDWVVEDPAALVKPGPTAKTLGVSTLGAVRDYLTANKDTLDLARLVVHVVSPNVVQVLGPLDTRARQREVYLTATVSDLLHNFLGTFMALSDFLIGLQVRFVDGGDDRARVLALLSTVKDETVKTALDDGMTQVVEGRVGVALVRDVAVPNPVTLTGFRTFRDVVHPASLFVLRVQAGKPGGLPTVALFEADGGAWQLQAIARVRDWLTEALPKDVAILA